MGQKALEQGTRIVVTDPTCGIPVGTTLTIKSYTGSGKDYQVSSDVPEYDGEILRRSQFDVITSVVDVFKKEQAKIEADLALVTQKIAYMESGKLDDFDHVQFQAWAALAIVEDEKQDQHAKAKALASVVRSK